MTGMPDEQGQYLMPAEDWVGRDIGGLRALASTLSGFAAQMRAARHSDPVTAAALAAVIGQTAGILDVLAVDLAKIQSALNDEAYVASRYGVTIGTDGRPPPVSARPAADAVAASARNWALAYRQFYELAMARARQARQRAATQLTILFAQLEPSAPALAKALPATNEAVSRPAGNGQGRLTP
jgi:hypothetical protein